MVAQIYKSEDFKMYAVTALVISVCILLIINVLTNPSIRISNYSLKIFYWTAPLLGAIILVITKLLPLNIIWQGLTQQGSINPLKILTLFISMTTLSIFLDEAGFFSYLAEKSLRASKANQLKLFTILFFMVSVLTVFTSNDIIILTFTPFICYFSKKADIDPMPYLFGEFVAANTFSMMLIIGNPTNIYLATAQGISFGSYTLHMWLPTLLAGITAYILLIAIFRKSLTKPIKLQNEKPIIRDKISVIIGLFHLISCTVFLIISSYVGMEMWYISLSFAVSLFACISIYKRLRPSRDRILLHTIARAPWELIPFVTSMFILVLGLEYYHVTEIVCNFLGHEQVILKYGIASFLSANVMNNIPMSVAFSSILNNLPKEFTLPATYACIVGSNLGAYFTPLGALAGIMWTGILNRMGLKFSFGKYISYGFRISFPILGVTLLGLSLVFGVL